MAAGGTETQLRLSLRERESELETARRVLAEARQGSGRVLLVEGAAGIGKSRLLEAISATPEAEGFEQHQARASELESEASFGIVLRLLEGRIRAASAAQRDELFRDAAHLARRLFEGDSEPHGWGADDRRFQLFHGLHWLIAALAERRPLLLGVDDAQWADEPSLGFLGYLAGRLEDIPVALVVTARDTAAPRREIAELAGTAEAALRLEPLSESAADDLVRGGLPTAGDALRAACVEAAGGNPFYLTELVRAIRAGEIPLEGEGPLAEALPTPDLVARAVPARIRAMGAAAWRLAEAIAVLGEPTSLHRAGRLAEIEPSEATDLADALGAADLLDLADPVSFAHPIVAAAVRAEIPPGRRERLHLRAAELLDADGGSPEQVAALLLDAARGKSAWVVDSLRRAARGARSRGAPRAAIGYLRRAREETVGRERRGALLAELGLTEAEAGEQSGRLALDESVELLADPGARGRALYDLAIVHAHGGRYARLREAAERGLAELDGCDQELASELAALEAQGHAWTDLADLEGSLRRFRAVYEGPAGESSAGGRLALASAAVRSSYGTADAVEVAALAGRSLRGYEPSDHPFDAAIPPLAGLALVYAGELGRAEEVISAAVERARRGGSILDLGAASHVRSLVHLHAGRLGEAIADAEGAVEAGRRGWGATLPMAHATLALCLLARGQVEEAAAALELPGGEERWASNVSYGAHVVARAEALRVAGEEEAALERLLVAGEMAGRAGVVNPVVLQWRPGAAAILAARGERERAAALLAEEEERARKFGAPRGIGIALRARGEQLGGAKGLESLGAAVEVLADSPDRYEHARALIELGAAMRREGRRREARRPLRQGTDAAHRCDAPALVTRGMEELRMTGARPRRPAASGAEALTPGERRVASLAAAGLGNREIAQSLFVTRRTVEMHLSNAYRKLGVANREELARLGPVVRGDAT